MLCRFLRSSLPHTFSPTVENRHKIGGISRRPRQDSLSHGGFNFSDFWELFPLVPFPLTPRPRVRISVRLADLTRLYSPLSGSGRCSSPQVHGSFGQPRQRSGHPSQKDGPQMKVTAKFRGGPLSSFFPSRGRIEFHIRFFLSHLCVRRLSHLHMRATVSTSVHTSRGIFLGLAYLG